MLHHPRMESRGDAHDRLPLWIETFIANVLITLNRTAQTGHRQAAFETFFQRRAQRCDQRVDQDRLRHRFGVRVTFAVLETEDHQLQVHADLRRGQADTADAFHGLEHVVDQLPQLRAVEHFGRHWRGDAQQAFIAHFQDFTNHGQVSSMVGFGCE
ncbi:hypothetical protein D3C72_1670000 [compost metagenome]